MHNIGYGHKNTKNQGWNLTGFTECLLYKQFYNEILSYKFKETDTADGVLSQLTMNKMVIYPFISEQKDFGYSDVTLSNMENAGRIREHFEYTKQRLKSIEYISRMYNKPI